jgi:hypothetical protein
MASSDQPLAHALSDQEVSYLKLLKTLRAAGQHSAADLGVVRRIAAWIDSELLLRYICLNPRWYDDWEVKEALLRNEATPKAFHSAVEGQVAIFDLLRELDSPHVGPEEQGEIREDVRSLFKTLTERDRNVVKARAYALSSSRRDGAATETATPEAAAAETEAVPSTGEPLKTSEIVLGLQGPIVEPELTIEPDLDLDSWLATEQARVEKELKAAEAARASEVRLEEPPELPDLTDLADLEEVSDLRLPEDFGDDDEPFAEPREVVGSSLSDLLARPIDQLSLEEKMWVASAAETRGVLEVLAYSTREEVVLALLDNPALPEELATALTRRATARVAQAIYRNRRLFQRPRVQEALLDCPNAPAVALLQVVNGLGEFSALLKVVTSPKIRHLEVKAKARSRLGERFRALSEGEKVAAVRRGGRVLLKELWRDFFRDEELVLRCVREKQLDEGSVLEIARSKIAPRRALEQIGRMPGWTGNYQIALALVLNPKTPRMITGRLLRKLSPADRRMVKNNPMLPEFVRDLA